MYTMMHNISHSYNIVLQQVCIIFQPGGSAFESGGLKVGHVILEVNGQSMVGLGHTAVAKAIAEAFKNKQANKMEMLVTETGVEVKGVAVVTDGGGISEEKG